MTNFHELQPPRAPRWLPLVLETEVSGEVLRFRTRRGGPWREVSRADILAADRVPLPRWSWPYSRRLDPGSEQLTSTSGQGVRLQLRGGRMLVLGSGRSEELLRALQGSMPLTPTPSPGCSGPNKPPTL